jgi:hypothetical protein
MSLVILQKVRNIENRKPNSSLRNSFGSAITLLHFCYLENLKKLMNYNWF